MGDDTVKETELFPKELILAIPLIGTALAISFDVGYFFGLDINLFTLFSISEHIVFALEASPFAVGMAVLIALLVGTGLHRRVAKPKPSSPEQKSRVRKIAGAIAVFALVLIIASVVIYFQKTVPFLAGCIAGVAAIVLSSSQLPKRTVYLVVAVLTIMSAFSIGYSTANSYVSYGRTRHSIQTDQETVPIKLIRSSDHGILYYEPKSKQLTFMKWDAIKKLTSSY